MYPIQNNTSPGVNGIHVSTMKGFTSQSNLNDVQIKQTPLTLMIQVGFQRRFYFRDSQI